MKATTILSAALAASIAVGAGPVHAQEASGATARVDARADAVDDDDGLHGAAVPGLVIAIIGGAAALTGGGILLVGAVTDGDPPQETGTDVGLNGVRGRAGQIDEGPGDLPAVGGALLGGGAIVHAIGIGLFFAGSWADEEDPPPPPVAGARRDAATVTPVVSPGFTGLRGTF